MALLDINIRKNIFKSAGAIGANIGSAAVVQKAKELILDKIGENRFISGRGFLGNAASRAVRNLLFTRDGAAGTFDPVWKLANYSVPDIVNGEYGNIQKVALGELAGQGSPKYRFNYTIELAYRSTLASQLTGVDDVRKGSKLMNTMALPIKTVTRPQPVVAYQDVNFYNYRSKVAVKVEYGTLTVTFYDDNFNTVHDIYEMYLKQLSPIASIKQDSFANNFDQFGARVVPNNDVPDVSSLGALPTNESAGLIQSITISHHLPLDYSNARMSSANNAGYVDGQKINATVVQYVYMNPKVVNMTLDDLDMSSNEPSMATLVFTYDSVYINKTPIEFTMASAVDTLNPVTPTVSRIHTPTVVENTIKTVNQTYDKINQSTILTKVKDFIKF
jgi:hypothetical protein